MIRRAFIGTLLVPSLAVVTPTAALADAKASQSSVHYQPKPNGDRQCLKCAFFAPGQTADANGTCQLVDGVIAPTGYCIAYNPK
jgi:hypothetical protein